MGHHFLLAFASGAKQPGETFDCRKLRCRDELKDGKETKLRVFAQLLDYERQVLMPAVKYCFKMRVLGDRLFLRRQI